MRGDRCQRIPNCSEGRAHAHSNEKLSAPRRAIFATCVVAMPLSEFGILFDVVWLEIDIKGNIRTGRE